MDSLSKLPDVTFAGPAPDDPGFLEELPEELVELLQDVNGCVALNGALHVRGVCGAPDWHSLKSAWRGPDAIGFLYSAVLGTDIPFAEDCMGDQFLLRNGTVARLDCETGVIKSLGFQLGEFLDWALSDPDEHLHGWLLSRLDAEEGSLVPGHLVQVFPPLFVRVEGNARKVRTVPTGQHLKYLASVAKKIASLPEGTPIRFSVKPKGT